MLSKERIDKKLFLSIAEASGLDIQNPHIEELYSYVSDILPILSSIYEIDVDNIIPETTSVSSEV